MASSRVMPSSTSTNSDLGRQNSTYSPTIGDLQGDQSKSFGSMSMDDLIRNIYGDNPPSSEMIGGEGGGALSRQASFPLPREVGSKTVEEVWKEISVSNGGGGGGGGGVEQKMGEVGERTLNEMTLEEFLTKAGAVTEEDVKIPPMVGPVTGFVVDQGLEGRYQQQEGGSGSGSIVWLGNGGGEKVGGGRGKRRAVMEPIDKVAQQRQRRMIKNRESAARSRERKQAYTVELESLVTQLEEENSRLQIEKENRNRERYNQLMEKLIPVEEKKKPDTPPVGVLRRSKSLQW